MIRFFAIALLTVTPALAQGAPNGRDVGGNIPRDKGTSVKYSGTPWSAAQCSRGG